MSDSSNPQGVGSHYDNSVFRKSQAKGWEILFALKDKIQAGMTEKDGHRAYKEVLEKYGIEKSWHPAKIRFGPNSIKSFREISDENYVLKDRDIFFLDIGPIINGYEADVGKSFALQPSPESYQRIIADGEEIFKLTKQAFLKDKLNGPQLYDLAEAQAKTRGWLLVGDGANGHRIGDFPHHVHYKGNLRSFTNSIIPDLWILEIQLRSPDMTFGAFFEDVL